MRYALALLLLAAAPASAQWRVEAFGSAGLSCETEVDVDARPVWDAAGNQSQTQSEYVRRATLRCKPAVSTGALFGRWREGRIGWGIGGHACACAGDTSLYPALTVHVGHVNLHLYAGLAWTPEDVVALPGGGSSQILVRGIDTRDLIIEDARSSVSLLIGLVLGATSLTGGGS